VKSTGLLRPGGPRNDSKCVHYLRQSAGKVAKKSHYYANQVSQSEAGGSATQRILQAVVIVGILEK